MSELVAILGQSQPRVSRHLRLLVEAGLATRQREGAWAFFRLAEPGGALAREWLRRLDPADPIVNADRVRLDIAREARRKQAAAYFATRAARLGSDPRAACAGGTGGSRTRRHDRREAVPQSARSRHGHGRMLELLAPRAARAVGVDQSAAMLALARARIDQAGLRHVSLRQGDIYAPPVERNAYDLVVIHQVLHFLDDPARALAEATRALAPGGRLAVVDFDAHDQEFLRDEFAHRRLGFRVDEVEGYLAEAGLTAIRMERVPPAKGESGKLTVMLWIAEDPRVISDDFQKADTEFA